MKKRPASGFKKAPPIRPPRAAAIDAGKAISGLAANVVADMQFITEWIKSGDMSPVVIANALDEQLRKWESINTSTIAGQWVGEVDAVVKTQLTERVRNALGVDTAFLLDDDVVRDAVELVSFETSSLIRDVPRRYIQNVAEAAIQNFKGVPFPDGRSLTQQLMEVNKETFERAKRIARQQTSAINATVNQVRQTAVGIEEYFWSSSFDERTVGNPGGLYPKGTKAHGEHYKRDYRVNGGKSYKWTEPFADGTPGIAPGCRCVAIARIDMDKLNPDRVIIVDQIGFTGRLVA